MGDLDLAIASFTTATTLNPYYVQAYNNAGNAKHLSGDLDGAIDSFIHAITVETGTHESKRRLAIHLSYGLPRRELFHPIISAHRQIAAIGINCDKSNLIEDNFLIDLYSKCERILEVNKIDFDETRSQIYRSNGKSLNCSRHKEIFKGFGIIPDYCVSCYKVQVEPTSVVELFKLFVIFSQQVLPLNSNST